MKQILTLYKQGGYTYETDNSTYTANTIEIGKKEDGTILLGSDTEIIEVIEGPEAYKRYYMIRFNKLEDKIRALILAVYPDILEKLNNGSKLKDPDTLFNLAVNKLAKEKNKFLETCSRCGGTGEHQYNQRYGTICFKCHGLKYTLPKITKKWLSEVEKFYK